jgi:hypothetical protein
MEGAMPELEGSVGEGQDLASDQTQELGAQGEGDGQGQEQPQQAKMVPLSEHVAQRKKFHARETALRNEISGLTSRLDRLESGIRGVAGDPQIDPHQKRFQEYAGVPRLEAKIAELEQELQKRGGIDPDLQARLDQIERAAGMAADAYLTGVEAQFKAAYNPKEIPLSAEAWERFVCGVMSWEETVRIANGDRAVANDVLKRAKGFFVKPGNPPLNPNLPRNHNNGQFMRRPPAAPGPGGSPPPAPPQEKLKGRKLHEAAWNVVQGAMSGASER